MSYGIGDQIIYRGELPCGLRHLEHSGIVDAVKPASEDQIVTVSFACVGGLPFTQDIPASELRYADDTLRYNALRFRIS